MRQLARLAVVGLSVVVACKAFGQEPDLNALLCDPEGWQYDKQLVAISQQTEHVRGEGPGLLFTYTRDSKDLSAPDEFNNAAYRPTATKALPGLDLSGYNRLSFWIYVEGNAEEAFQWGFSAGAPFRLSCRRGEWFHARWDFPEDPAADLKNVTQFIMRGVNQGSPPEDPKRAHIYLSDFKLEKVAEATHAGWQPNPHEIILPFVGVYPGEAVTALLAPQHGRKQFSFAGKEGTTSDVRRTARTSYAEIRLVVPDKPGDYSVTVEDGPSATLRVRERPYDEAIAKALTALRAQRCGIESELHAVCHLDDAVRADTGEAVDVCGGWHDEGVSQFAHLTIRTTTSLARFRRSHRRLSINAEYEDAVQDELEWGLRSILKYEVAPALHLHSFVQPQWYYTDNRPGTGDERHVNVQHPHQLTCWWFIEALALGASVCDDPLRDKARASAERCWALHREVDRIYTQDEQERWKRDAKNLRVTAARVAASVEMFRLTGEQQYAVDAAQQGNYLLTFQEKKSAGDGALVGYFYKNLGFPEPYTGVGNKSLDVPGKALAELLMALPDHADAPRWREALRLFVEGTLKPLARFNAPYGYVASGPYRKPITTLFAREERGGMFVYPLHFKDSRSKKGLQSTETEAQLTLAAQLAAMGRALGDKELIEMAHGALRYLLGANPFHVSIMRHFGERWPENAQLPNVPGMMLCRMGITSAGVPFFNLRGGCRLTEPPRFAVKEGNSAQCAFLQEACSYLEDASH